MNKKISKWTVIPGLLLSLLIAVLFLSEWVNIGVIADPETISKYYFGSDAMVGKYWYYESAKIYAMSNLVEGLIFAGIAALFGYSLFLKSNKMLLLSYSLLGTGLLARIIW